MNFRRCLLILVPSLAASIAVADEKVSVYVEYRHGPVHVHYPLPCAYASTCSLTSLDDVEIPWKVEVTPAKSKNGIVSVTTVVRENSQEVSRSNILTKLGEEAKIVSSAADGTQTELTIRPF